MGCGGIGGTPEGGVLARGRAGERAFVGQEGGEGEQSGSATGLVGLGVLVGVLKKSCWCFLGYSIFVSCLYAGCYVADCGPFIGTG